MSGMREGIGRVGESGPLTALWVTRPGLALAVAMRWQLHRRCAQGSKPSASASSFEPGQTRKRAASGLPKACFG